MNQIVCSTCNGAGGTLVRDKTVPKAEAKYYHQDPAYCKKVKDKKELLDKVAEAKTKADVIRPATMAETMKVLGERR